MIIQYPTGFYKDVIPQTAGDVGNVTYTISNTTPPRTNLVFPKIPNGLVDRKRPARTISPAGRRTYLGELLFTVSTASKSDSGNNSRQHEIGQILNFGDAPPQTVEPMLVGKKTEIRHDTNAFDYTALGLSEVDQQFMAASSLAIHTELADRLNELKQLRANAEEQINVQQKVINEVHRTLAALTVIRDTASSTGGEVEDLIIKLESRRDAAFKQRDAAKAVAEQYASDAEVMLAKLRAVATVLK